MHILNTISIKAYLAQHNILPVKETEYTALYHSPLREDRNASFKVDLEKNLWIDYGTNEGSTLIDLVMKLKQCSTYNAMLELEQIYQGRDISLNVHAFERSNVRTDSFSFHGKESSPSLNIQRVTELVHPALLQYLGQRGISTKLAKEYCKQIHYATNHRNYFAIGFKNDSDGWNLRSEGFKGCTSMDITTYQSSNMNKDTCLVFEGFMDYLSYLTRNNLKEFSNNIVVLNSTSNLSKAIDFIQSHDKVYTYLDNDEGGRKATELINLMSKIHFNKSTDFANFKDLNDYHVSSQKREVEERKPSRGFRL